MSNQSMIGKVTALVTLLVGIALSTSGCGALIVGYLVGDAIQKSKSVDACRSTLQSANQARIAKGESPVPDQCG